MFNQTGLKDANRYLIRVLTDNAENGSKYLKIIGGNSNTDLFIMTLINVNSFNYEEPCYVYLMTDNNNGYTKIGISNNPLYRENTLQSEKPSIILRKKLQFSSRNKAREFEKKLHEQYKDLRIRGEWYNLDTSILVLLLNEYDWRQPKINVV